MPTTRCGEAAVSRDRQVESHDAMPALEFIYIPQYVLLVHNEDTLQVTIVDDVCSIVP